MTKAIVIKSGDEQILRNMRHGEFDRLRAKNRAERRKLEALEKINREREEKRVESGKFGMIRGLDKLKVG
jgi:hypothetical protein